MRLSSQEEEDLLIASFNAAEGPYTLGNYEIDDSNLMSYSIVEDSGSPSGKALYVKRLSEGTKETGCYLDLGELTLDGSPALEENSTYRFEYVIKGSEQWGIETDQTSWYPRVPVSNMFSTGFTT